MQQLTKRLRALDPEAAEELKVVSYFDELIAAHANPETLLRGATALAGVAVGFETPRTTLRVDVDGLGSSPPQGYAATWYSTELSGRGRVWLEREGEPRTIDRMIATRLAIALSLTLSQNGRDRSSLELLIDPETSPIDKVEAARRLRLTSSSSGRMIATPVGVGMPPRSVVVTTSVGFVAATYVPDGVPIPTTGVVGVGTAATGLALVSSWRSAVLALRLVDGGPFVADDLGALLPLLLAGERDAADHPDVRIFAQLAESDPGLIATAKALANERSVRAAAVVLGLHPSTVHARIAWLTDALGFDPVSPEGRVRTVLALRMHQLTQSRLGPDA